MLGKGLDIRVSIKMDSCFTICQYNSEQPENIEIPNPVSLEI